MLNSNAGEPIVGFDSRWPFGLDDSAPDEIDEMCVNRAPGSAPQPRLKTDVEPFDDSVDPLDAGAQAIEYAGFTFAPMGDKGADVLLRLGNRGSVGRPVDHVTTAKQFVE